MSLGINHHHSNDSFGTAAKQHTRMAYWSTHFFTGLKPAGSCIESNQLERNQFESLPVFNLTNESLFRGSSHYTQGF